MTRTLNISKTSIRLLLVVAIAAGFVTFAARADASSPSEVKATCYSDGYIRVFDGGNVAGPAQRIRMQIAHMTSYGWRWTTYSWRDVNGSSFRFNTTKGARYWIHVTIATQNGSGGWSYDKGYVSVTNVKVSPIGAIEIDSRTVGLCKT
jgi:hypothetical protein